MAAPDSSDRTMARGAFILSTGAALLHGAILWRLPMLTFVAMFVLIFGSIITAAGVVTSFSHALISKLDEEDDD